MRVWWVLPIPILLTMTNCVGGKMAEAETLSLEVREIRMPNGDSELRLVDPQGNTQKTYKLNLSTHHHPATSEENPAISRWRSWKFGAFISYNSNQFTGDELCNLSDPSVYAPENLDVSQWIETLEEAGMKYAVLTTRHTSGFLLWDSPTTEFDVASSGNPTDVAGAFVEECRRRGIAPGFYYCMWGGRYRPDPNARAIILAQLYELATRYGPIPYFWIDMMNWAPEDLSAQEVYDMLKNIDPETVVILNQHIQRGTEIRYFPTDVLNGEMMMPPTEGHRAFREIDGATYYLPFEYELCSQKREGEGAWKANSDYPGYVWFTYGKGKSFTPSEPLPPRFLRRYVDDALRRGANNILLSCAPDHTGQFRPEDVEQLTALGKLIRSASASGESDPPGRGRPTPEQLAWHEMEIEMFLALDPCTWQGREYDDHSTPLGEIDPKQLDTDQWCEVAKSFGAKQILFVAKHTGGFCWWQTDTSDYSIKNTPYKDGNGDVLAELAASCKKHGLKLGVYIYPGDDQWGAGIGSGGRTEDPSKQQAYNEVLRRQWTEVLTGYGPISEVWFDGSCVIEVGDILNKYAPKAMVFQGPHATLRWPGNEKGIAPYPTWQTVKKEDALTGVSTAKHSDPDGDVWLPMEMDTPLLDHKWFWGPNTDHMIKSLPHLMEIYYKSVGRGCVLLLNATPDTTGRIPASHVERYREFGEAIQRIYENKKGETAGIGYTFTLLFKEPTLVNHIVTMENIRYGQAVRRYVVEGRTGKEWNRLLEGESIGYKKIDVLDPVRVEGVRLRIVEAVDEPVIDSFAVYEAPTLVEESTGTEISSAWQRVSSFQPSALNREWQTLNIDLTPYIRQPGQFEVEFRKSGGEANLRFRKAVVVMARAEAPRLITRLERPNAWNINRTAAVTPDEKGNTVFRITVRLEGGSEWEGGLYIRAAD